MAKGSEEQGESIRRESSGLRSSAVAAVPMTATCAPWPSGWRVISSPSNEAKRTHTWLRAVLAYQLLAGLLEQPKQTVCFGGVPVDSVSGIIYLLWLG